MLNRLAGTTASRIWVTLAVLLPGLVQAQELNRLRPALP